MDLIKNDEFIEIRVTLEELLIFNNSLNELCHGLNLFEFETRMGASYSDVQTLLKKVGDIIDEISTNKM